MSRNQLSELIAAGFTDTSGIVLSAGKVYHYAAGTTTPKDMYTDLAGTTPAAQPIVLDGAGSARVFGAGNYKLIIQDVDSVVIRTIDNYQLGPVSADPTKVTVSTSGQLLFTVPAYIVGSGSLRVYLDGVRLSLAAGDYTETSSTQITLSSAYAPSISPTSTVLLVEVF